MLRHKWHVLRAGYRLGVPLWRLLIHDWTKFTRAEWGPYVRRFYGTSANPDEFGVAWRHHYERNPHHPEYWRRLDADSTLHANWMPETYVREMIADWYGAGMAQGKRDVMSWYLANQDRLLLHDGSRYLALCRLEYSTGSGQD